jgi:F-type H+-transporting ATPase subunit b
MDLLTPGTGLIIWQLIVFLLLFFLLAKLAWKPIISSLKEREKSIQDALDTAEKARLEMSRLKSDNENLLKQAREEREKMLRDARDASNRLKEEAQADARKSADRIIEEARAAINAEKLTALKEVKALVADLSLDVASKILRKNLSSDKAQKELTQEYIKDIKLN